MAGRWWRALVGVLGSFALVPVVVLAAAAPAHACSCAMGDTSDHVGWADGVFTGSIVEVDTGAAEESASSDDEMPEPLASDVRFLVEVDQVYKGEIGTRVALVTSSGGASCGIDPLPGDDETWLWFVSAREEGGYGVYICGGSGPVKEKTLDQVVDITGPGTEGSDAVDADTLDDAADPQSSAPGPESDADGGAHDDADGGETSDAVPWGIGGVLLVLGVAAAGVVVVRRRA